MCEPHQVWPLRSECCGRGVPTKVVCAKCMKMCCLGGKNSVVTESVDSVCRDTTYTQYMLIQKNLSKSQKRYTYKPLLPHTVHLRVFSRPTRLLASRKTVVKVPHQVLAKRANCFSFFFFFLSSDGLAQRSLNLSRWFLHETAAFYTEQCTSPSLFRNFQVFTRRLQLPTQ